MTCHSERYVQWFSFFIKRTFVEEFYWTNSVPAPKPSDYITDKRALHTTGAIAAFFRPLPLTELVWDCKIMEIEYLTTALYGSPTFNNCALASLQIKDNWSPEWDIPLKDFHPAMDFKRKKILEAQNAAIATTEYGISEIRVVS